MYMNQANEVFKRCMQELDIENRRVLELRYENELSNEKIASIINVPLVEVEWKISSARNLLFEKLEKLEGHL
jgi:DNA-directed RNA polymerase specialized sigma24 family protein